MTDSDLQAARRLALATDDPQDEARYLAAAMRSGRLSQGRITLAAALGSNAAKLVLPDVAPVGASFEFHPHEWAGLASLVRNAFTPRELGFLALDLYEFGPMGKSSPSVFDLGSMRVAYARRDAIPGPTRGLLVDDPAWRLYDTVSWAAAAELSRRVDSQYRTSEAFYELACALIRSCKDAGGEPATEAEYQRQKAALIRAALDPDYPGKIQ